MLAYTLFSHMHVCYHAKNTWTAEENLFFELAPSFGSLNLAPLGSVVLGSSLNRVRSVLLGLS